MAPSPGHHLRCAGCGASRAARGSTLEEAWYRCRGCGTPNPVLDAEASGFVAPGARLVVQRRRGVTCIVMPSHTVMSTLTFTAMVLMTPGIAMLFAGAFEAEATGILRVLGTGGILLLGLASLAGQCTAWLVVRTIELRRDGGRLVWSMLGHVIRERPLPRGLVARRAPPRPSVQTPPVELTDARGGVVHRMGCPDEREAEWLVAVVNSAGADDAAARCTGCGAPIEAAIEERAAGATTCAQCGTGFVSTSGPPAWTPVVLDARPGAPARGTWRFGRAMLVVRAVYAFSALYGLAMFGGGGIFLISIVSEVEARSILFPCLIVYCALAVIAFGIALLIFAVDVVAGERRLVIADGRVCCERTWFDHRAPDVLRRLSTLGRRGVGAIPLYPIQAATIEADDLGAHTLQLSTPTKSLEIPLDREVGPRVLAVLGTALEEAGRVVEWREHGHARSRFTRAA